MEPASLHEQVAEVINCDGLKEIFPPLVTLVKHVLGSDEGLHPTVPQDEILNFHAVINVRLELVVLNLARAVIVNLGEYLSNEVCNFRLLGHHDTS